MTSLNITQKRKLKMHKMQGMTPKGQRSSSFCKELRAASYRHLVSNIHPLNRLFLLFDMHDVKGTIFLIVTIA